MARRQIDLDDDSYYEGRHGASDPTRTASQGDGPAVHAATVFLQWAAYNRIGRIVCRVVFKTIVMVLCYFLLIAPLMKWITGFWITWEAVCGTLIGWFSSDVVRGYRRRRRARYKAATSAGPQNGTR